MKPPEPNELQKKRNQDAQVARRDFLDALHRLFSDDRGQPTPDGTRLLDALRAAAGLPTSTGLPGTPNFRAASDGHACPYIAATRDGRQSLVRDLESWLREPRDGSSTGPG